MNDDIVIYDGVLTDKRSICLLDGSRGLYYGDGCFETFRSYKGKFLHIEQHIHRLCEAALYLELQYSLPDIGNLKESIKSLLKEKNLLSFDSVIRIQLWRKGNRGFSPDESKSAFMIEAHKLVESEEPYTLATVDTKVIPEVSLSRRFKLSNSLNYIKASQQAKVKGANAALMLTINNKISETELANIFWVKDNVIYTPSVACDILPGITRDVCIKTLVNQHELQEGVFDLHHIMEADAVWLTNSLKEIVAVKELDGHIFDSEHLFLKELKSKFQEYKHEHLL